MDRLLLSRIHLHAASAMLRLFVHDCARGSLIHGQQDMPLQYVFYSSSYHMCFTAPATSALSFIQYQPAAI